jgi:hypothetical protein
LRGHPARLLLETLRFSGGPEAETLAAEWSAADDRGLDHLVMFESCGSWLFRRLRQIGVLDSVDPGFAEWLADLAREETARNMIVDAEARAVAMLLSEVGVPAVFLKGIARRVSVERYPLADARLTNDVDILVPADQAREVWHELRRRGYRLIKPWRPPRPEHHHLAGLMSDRRVGVEVHTTTNYRRIPPAEAWKRLHEGGVEVLREGVCYRVPSATEMFWGGAAHALLPADDAFVLAHLFSSAVIWAAGGEIDWVEVRRRLESKEIPDRTAACAWLNAVAQLVGAQVPPELVDALEPYDLGRALELRLAVLRHLRLPMPLWKGLAWWSNDQARRCT